jgi:hypothetical protein
MFRILVAAFAATCLLGCTSMQVMDQPAAPATQQKLKVGEQVSVLTKTQHHYDLKITAVDAESFIGRDSADKAWTVRYDQIEQLQTRQFDGWKTTGLVGGIVASLYVLLLIAANAVTHDLNHAFSNP